MTHRIALAATPGLPRIHLTAAAEAQIAARESGETPADGDVRPADVQQVLLAGSFGSYLSAASAVRIGLVPAEELAER